MARGSDFLGFKSAGHFIPYDTERCIDYAKEYMRQFEYEYLYLSREDANILEKSRITIGEEEVWQLIIS